MLHRGGAMMGGGGGGGHPQMILQKAFCLRSFGLSAQMSVMYDDVDTATPVW